MDPKIRETYLKFIFILFEIYFILLFSKAFRNILETHLQREIIGASLILLATIFSIDGTLQPVKWKKRIYIPILLGSIGLIVTGMMHPIGSGYMSFGVSLLLIYPGFYFVWNNRKDYETLFDIVSKANTEIGTIFFIYSIVFFWKQIFQEGRGRFQGSISDPNLFSLVGMAMVCSSMYMIYRKRTSKKLPLFYAASGAMGFVIIVFGQSRSALLVGLGALVVTMIFAFKNSNKLNSSTRKAMIILIVVMLCGNASMMTVYAESHLRATDTPPDGFIDRFSLEGQDLNSFTSGRIKIWANYAGKLNMTGNNFDETNWEEMTGDTVKHAHNNFLEYGYRCGVPVAIAFILLELFAGLITLKYLFSRKWRRDCYLYTVLCLLMYAAMSMIDIATIPTERYAPYIFYLSLTLLIDADENHVDANNIEKQQVI